MRDQLPEDRLARVVVDSAFKVHTTLGPGLLESVYVTVLAHELERRGIPFEREVVVPVRYEDLRLDKGFRADFIVGKRVILEIKAQERLLPVHQMQLLTYVRLSGLRLGLLLNFGSPLIRDGIQRVANNLPPGTI